MKSGLQIFLFVKAYDVGVVGFSFYEYFWLLTLIQSALVAIFIVVVGLFAEAAYRAAATRFLLIRQKKPGKEKTTLAASLSGGTHGAPASLHSNSRRKYEGRLQMEGVTHKCG